MGRWNRAKRNAERPILKGGLQQYIGSVSLDYIKHNREIKNLIIREFESNDKFDLLRLADELGYDDNDILAWFNTDVRGASLALTHAAIIRMLNVAGYDLRITIEDTGKDEINDYTLPEECYEIKGNRIKIKRNEYYGRFSHNKELS